MSTFQIEWTMDCEVNGSRFTLNGLGQGDSATGTCDMDQTTSGFPEGFDPVSCPRICGGVTTLLPAYSGSSPNPIISFLGDRFRVSPARVGNVFDSSGRQVLRLAVSSDIHFDGKILKIHNVMRGDSHLPKLSHNLIEGREYITPAGPGKMIAVSEWKLITKAGDVLNGLTTVPFDTESSRQLACPLVRDFTSVVVEWSGSSVKTHVSSEIRPASAGSAHNMRFIVPKAA